MDQGSHARPLDVTGLFALIAVAGLMPWPLLIGPDNWWAFVLVSVAIMAVLRLVYGVKWASHAGLKVPPAEAVMVVATFALVAAASTLLLPIVYKTAGLKVEAPHLMGQIGFLFQSLNEEILFRALMIGFIVHYVRSATLVSLGLALVFSAAHFFMYFVTNPLHMALSPGALATLFLAGAAWNNLYLAFRHIGFSWALHAGWNVAWLPAVFYDATTNAPLYEPQIFDRVLGSPIIVALAGAVAAISFVLLARHSAEEGRVG